MSKQDRCVWLRRIMASLLVLLPGIPQSALADALTIPPVRSFPFDVSRGDSTLDVEIQIREYRNYYFALQFDYAGRDDEYRVEKLVGGGSTYTDGKYEKPGIVAPIRLEIVRIDGDSSEGSKVIYKDTVESQGHYVHGFTEIKFNGHYRRMLISIALKPGLYRVHVNTIRDSPEFVGTPTHLKIEWHPNARRLD